MMTVEEIKEQIRIAESNGDREKAEALRKKLKQYTINEQNYLLNENRKIKAYYGISPTGPIHLGYFIPLSKVFDFELAGIETTILIADIHAALDDLKTKWDELDLKTEYYKKTIELAFPWIKTPKFIRGSEFQLEKNYILDVLKLSTLTTITRAKRAASEVTRMKNPKVSELIYPIMQALDEQYLNVDIQLGGIDQRHIMAYAREYLPYLGYKKRIEIMTPLTLSLKGKDTKMSASIPESHIKVYESEESLRRKIRKAYCPEKQINENPVLQIAQFIIFPLKNKMKIEREEKFGGDLILNSYKELELLYSKGDIHPLDLKNAVANYLIDIFKKVREYYMENIDMLKELGDIYLPQLLLNSKNIYIFNT